MYNNSTGGSTTTLSNIGISDHISLSRYLDQIKVRDSSVEVKLDVPRKHVSAQDVIDSLNMENIKVCAALLYHVTSLRIEDII